MPEFSGFSVPWEQLPDEIKQQIMTQQATAEDYRHSVARMFDELSEEHLKILQGVFHNISSASEGPGVALTAYYEGLMAVKMQQRFNLCIACGVDHDKALAEFGSVDDKGHPVQAPNSDPQKADSEPAELTPEDLANMERYNLDDVRDPDTLKLLGFICINCKMPYQSLEDRMKREPGEGGCSGCIQKTKWG